VSTDQGQMQVAGKTAVQCQPGCAVAEHRHGASSSGGGGGGGGSGGGSKVSEARGELMQSAEDQRDGYNHYGKFGDWIEQVQADLLRIMEDTSHPELDEILALLGSANQLLAESQQQLMAAADVTERLAEKL
jgi:hypothetical protein